MPRLVMKFGGTSVADLDKINNVAKKICKEVPKHDLIHIHGTRHAFSFITAYYAKMYNKKYIITPHASLMQWWMDEIGNPFIKKFYMKKTI